MHNYKIFTWLMDSIPPATITSWPWPNIKVCAANETVFMPLLQTLLTVVQHTDVGSPAKIAACRAGAWP